ncbi:MAG: glycosyl hydrolase family 18 protein [Desulfitobacteriaceae bacterium]
MNSIHWVPTAQHLTEKRLWVLGYAAEDFPGDTRALESIRQYGSHLDVYVDFSFQIQEDADLSGSINWPLLQAAETQGVAPWILFHNFNGFTFDPKPLRSILSSPGLQRKFIRNIMKSLPPSTAGVHLDLEAIEAPYRIAYVDLLDSLRASLHEEGRLLTIAVPAKRSEWEAPGYDFARIGQLCDAVTLMTYDEHFSGGSPGPIASLPWMTEALDYAIRLIPREKLLVGIPVYGYDWSNQPTRMIPLRDIPTLAAETGAKILWSDPDVEPYFHYWRGRERHTVWFENELSTKTRLGFVKTYRLRGIAIWRLGYETGRFWQGVSSKLGR